ncbi:tetratricopeptide repeat protein [Lutimaribacter sp. EGI FJ00015]|nr:tetratricopeptide repeat protein [Lutimaribacter sp. EGI FJ00015]
MVLVGVVLSLSGCVTDISRQATQQTQAEVVSQSITLLSQMRFSEALSTIKKVRPLSGTDARAIMTFAIASDMTGQFGAASKAYDKLADSHAKRADFLNNMGYSMMLQGKLDKALVYLREAKRLDPDNATVANNLKMLTSVVPTR